MKDNGGFTLTEVLIATVVLVVAVVSMLGLFTHSLALTEAQGASTIAQYVAEEEMEEILGLEYTNGQGIKQLYTNINANNDGLWRETNLNLADPNMSGTVYAEEIDTTAILNRLMRIKVVVCYRHKNRIIGEDNGSGGGGALNGALDGTEDTNGNGELDSPCQLETVVVNQSY